MYHFLKPQTCSICGLKWGSTFNEGYIQLGRPVIECSGCWEPIHTGRKEWRQLRATQKWTYLAQSVGYMVPVVFFLALSLGGVYLDDGDMGDAMIWTLWLGAAAFALILLRSFLQVASSMRRTTGKRADQPAR